MLPPLMFSEQEIEALVLGSRWVAERGDIQLSAAARSALTKVAAVLPKDLCNKLDATALLVGPSATISTGTAELMQIRRAIHIEKKLEANYLNLKSIESTRVIWPFALGYFGYTFIALDPDGHRLRVFSPSA